MNSFSCSKLMNVTPVILLATTLLSFSHPVSAKSCEVLASSCIPGFDLDVRKGQDKCVAGPIEAFTGPEGKFITTYPPLDGWSLLVNYKRKRDYWKKCS